MGQGKSREIRGKIKSVKNTEKITKAMKLVSASKLRKASMGLENFGPFYEGIEGVLHKVTASGTTHKLTRLTENPKALIVVYSGERALCGAYNANAVKRALGLQEELEAKGYSVVYYSIGKKGAEQLRLKNQEVIKEYNLSDTVPAFDISQEIASDLLELFLSGEFGEIHISYTKFFSAASKTNELVRFLPYHPDDAKDSDHWNEESEDWVGKTHYFFEPSKEDILEELFQQYLGGTIHNCFLNSLASEYGSRMVAMDNASRNAKELIAELTLKLNRARQAAITQEIAEIVGGAASLE